MNQSLNPAENVKPRLHHLDMLKGLAIFFVVIGHVVALCVRGIDRTIVLKFVAETHMPIFFFISGWLGVKFMQGSTSRWRVPSLYPRAKRLLIPMIVTSSLWILYLPHTTITSPFVPEFGALWHDSFKQGYWFTYVLMQEVIIYAALVPVMNRFKSLWGKSSVAFAGFVVLCMAYECMDGDMAGILSFDMTVAYFPVFIGGALAASESRRFMALTENTRAVTVAILTAAPLFYLVSWPWDVPMDFAGILGNELFALLRGSYHILLAFVAFAVVAPWARKAFAGDNPSMPSRPLSMTWWARIWCYLGRESLAIYLLHYFFLFNLGDCRSMLEGMGLAFVPTLAFATFWAVLIMAVVLCFNTVIKHSGLLAFLLTGARPAKTPKK